MNSNVRPTCLCAQPHYRQFAAVSTLNVVSFHHLLSHPRRRRHTLPPSEPNCPRFRKTTATLSSSNDRRKQCSTAANANANDIATNANATTNSHLTDGWNRRGNPSRRRRGWVRRSGQGRIHRRAVGIWLRQKQCCRARYAPFVPSS